MTSFGVYFFERALDDFHPLGKLVGGCDEGRQAANDVAVTTGREKDQSAAVTLIEDLRSLFRRWLPGSAVAHQLDRPHGAQSANISDQGKTFFPVARDLLEEPA